MLTSLIVSTLLMAGEPATVTADDLKFNAVEIQKQKPTAEIRLMEQGKEVIYKGIPLRSVLVNEHVVETTANPMGSLRKLSDAVLLVGAPDDFQATVSAAAVAMDLDGTRYFLATMRDGKPLGDDQGPVKLIIPADPQHVRWVRMVNRVELVRMPRTATVKVRESK